jgi:hypothetical protein
VLIGDGIAHRAFSIGPVRGSPAKTRSRWRVRSTKARGRTRCASQVFEQTRRPIVDKIVRAANRSSFWYERLQGQDEMEPWELAYDYMTRSGRMSDERLRESAPQFHGDGGRASALDPRRGRQTRRSSLGSCAAHHLGR